MKVAIIGAGLAGLTTAQELNQRGVDVTVFEKSQGLGGRLANKRLDWAHLDLGAQYFTARDPRFIAFLEQWQTAVAAWQFTPHKLTAEGLVASPDNTLRFVGTPAMNDLAKVLARDLPIHTRCRITQLIHAKGVWQLVTEDQQVFEGFTHVVLALPAEQSRELLANFAIAKHIPAVVHHPCWALALATKGELAGDAIQGIFGDKTISWVSRLSARPKRLPCNGFDDLWMLHFAGQWSVDNGRDTPLPIEHIGFEWLQECLKEQGGSHLSVAHSYRHYWTYARPHPDYQSSGILRDKALGLSLIGDWTSGGRIEGAFLSAQALLDSLS